MAKSNSNECLECGKATSNPRFCGRSCAAKYNNRKSPKRSPEGKCKTCQAAIPTSRTYCSDCLKEQKQEKEAARQRPKIRVDQRTVFSFGYHRLSQSESIGTFLEAFESVAEQQPVYLRPNDWQRHREFIGILRGFSCDHYGRGMTREELSAVDFPLERLQYVLHQWVESAAYSRDSHPLAATFALDTANVLHSHAYGEHCYSCGEDSFELAAMVEGESRRAEIADQRLKKEITERDINGMCVIARVPEAATASVYREAIGRECADVCFLPLRCHLSSSWNEDYELVFETQEPQFNLSADFEFHGQFLIAYNENIDRNTWEWWKHSPTFAKPNLHEGRVTRGHLPINWITHCGYQTFQIDEMKLVPSQWKSFASGNRSESESTDGTQYPAPPRPAFLSDLSGKTSRHNLQHGGKQKPTSQP